METLHFLTFVQFFTLLQLERCDLEVDSELTVAFLFLGCSVPPPRHGQLFCEGGNGELC